MRPKKLEMTQVNAWVEKHTGWEIKGNAITKAFKFPDFATAMGFAVRLGMAAEKKDHHPDIEIGWGRARITWSTHDAGGITELDSQMAELTDTLA